MLRIKDARMVLRDADVERKHAIFCQKNKALIESYVAPGPPLVAYVNWGRWVIDCRCGSGAAVELRKREAYCFECGGIHRDVQLPPADILTQIESVLERRTHLSAQNWSPTETVDDLRAENAAHEVY